MQCGPSASALDKHNNNNSKSQHCALVGVAESKVWSAEEDSHSSWDCDVGDLVIDLERESATHDTMSSPYKQTPHSKTEHQATVNNNKGLKMKIKRTGGTTKQSGATAGTGCGSATSKSSADGQHEVVNSEQKAVVTDSVAGEEACAALDKCRQPQEKEKKGRGGHKKDRKEKSRSGEAFHAGNGSTSLAGTGSPQQQNLVTASAETEPARQNSSGQFAVKQESVILDPYEFNAKVEDRIGLPVTKKIKVEKVECSGTSHAMPPPPPPQDDHLASGDASAPSAMASTSCCPGTQDKAVCTQHVGVLTDPDCLGPCEPGTSVTLEGIVWHETHNGVLVVNVTWRGKTYVGTLLDATKHDWAPPRFSSDSPTSDLDSRTPKGRGRRARGAATPKAEAVGDRRLRNRRSLPAPVSPGRSDVPSSAAKRRAAQTAEAAESSNGDGMVATKRSRCSSRNTPTRNGRESPTIECPEPNCFKKYKHLNGLKFHQTKAHPPKPAGGSGKSQKYTEIAMETDESSPTVGAGSHEHHHQHKHGHKSKSKKPHTVTGATMNTASMPSSSDPAMCSAGSKVATAVGTSTTTQTSPAAASSTQTVTKDSKVASTASKTQQQGDNKVRDVKAESKGRSATQPTPGLSSPQAGTDTLKTGTAMPPMTSSTQVYQLATTPIACLGGTMTVVTQSLPANPVSVTGGATVVQATTTQIPVGTSVTTLPVTVVPGEKKSRQEKDKSKGKGGVNARPIVPAPTTTSYNAQSSGSHSTTTGSTGSQLKAIQPRPTVMGDPPSVNPALSSLRELKEKKNKKSKKERKDKERAKDLAGPCINKNTVSPGTTTKPGQANCGVTGSAMQQQQLQAVPSVDSGTTTTVPSPLASSSSSSVISTRSESLTTSVIKSLAAGSMGKSGNAESLYGAGLMTQQQQAAQLAHQLAHHHHQQAVQQAPEMLQKPPELHKQPGMAPMSESKDVLSSAQHVARPPSSLSLNSPLQPSSERERSSDVHSPAYSDISDANDTAPTLENEAEQKPLGDKASEPVHKARPPDGTVGHYGMYDGGPQAGPPYLMPAISHPGLTARESQTGTPDAGNKIGDRSSDSKMTASLPKGADGGNKEVGHAEAYPGRSQYQNYVASVPSAYGYAIDSAYHMHLMDTNPQYRAQHEKLHSEDKGEEKKAADDNKAGEDGERKAEEVTMSTSTSTGSKLPVTKDYKTSLPKPPSLVSDKDREEHRQREMPCNPSVVDKKHENQQILKENLDLKTQMGSSGHPGFEHGTWHRSDMHMYHSMLYLQRQQQQQTAAQSQHSPGSRKAPETVTSPSRESAVQHPDQQHGRCSELHEAVDMDSKRAAGSGASMAGSRDGDEARDGSKQRSEDRPLKSESKSPSPRPSPRPGSTDSRSTPNRPRDMLPSSTGPVPVMPSPYAPYFHPGYVQPGMPQPFPAQLPMDLVRHPGVPVDPRGVPIDPRQLAAVDPRHAAMLQGMNPAVMGYPSTPYIYQAQVRYPDGHPASHMDGADKGATLLSPGSVAPEGKALDLLQQHAQHYYSNTHKIHELKEAARRSTPPPCKPPPAPASTPREKADAPSPASSSNKSAEKSGSPPPQRHVHTHHHTHVVGASTYPIYGPYGALIPSPPDSIEPAFVPKP